MKVIAIMLACLMVLSSQVVFAAQNEDPVTGTVKTVGRAAQGTVETAVSPITALGKGEPDKMITDPVEKGGKTVYNATENAGKALTSQKVDQPKTMFLGQKKQPGWNHLGCFFSMCIICQISIQKVCFYTKEVIGAAAEGAATSEAKGAVIDIINIIIRALVGAYEVVTFPIFASEEQEQILDDSKLLSGEKKNHIFYLQYWQIEGIIC